MDRSTTRRTNGSKSEDMKIKRCKLASCSTVRVDCDRLSALPDNILINNILCLVPMKEAQRCSILAKRWRFLWTRLPVLDFDASQVAVDILRCNVRKPTQPYFCKTSQAGSKYAASVSKAIAVCRRSSMSTTPLRRLRICFPLDPTFFHDIQSWVNFSFERGVEALDLNFCTHTFYNGPYCAFPLVSPYQFPKCRLLKSLCLRKVALRNDTLRDLLLGCQSLERLQLIRLGNALTEMRVTGPVSRLKYIDIHDANHMKSIVISAPTPDLISFKFYCKCQKIHIQHAPRLVDLLLHYWNNDILSHPLLHLVPQLESLELSIRRWHMAKQWLPSFPNLSSLKHLKLHYSNCMVYGYEDTMQSLMGLASVISAVPSVQHLTLKLRSGENMLSVEDEFEGLHLRCLRVLEIVGYCGWKHYAFAKCLIKDIVSPSLEKLIIDFRHPFFRGEVYSEYSEEPERVECQKKQVLKLKQVLPPEAELVVI